MASSAPLRLGVIGAGANTREKHLPGFQTLPGVSVEVVCNRSPASSQTVADAFGIPRIASDWSAVVADPTIDAICIGTWPYLHAPITIAALAAGKHVLTEARMAMNASEAAAMVEAARQQPECVAQIVPSPITLPWDATIARLVATGAIGVLREIHFVNTSSASADPAAPLSWRLDRSLSGHNTMALGICYEAIQRWTLRRPTRVWATGTTFTTRRLDPATGAAREVEVPESLNFVARGPEGPVISGYLSSVESGPGRSVFVLNGSSGTLTLDLTTQELRHTPHHGETRLVDIPTAERGGWQVEADFVASIREGRPVTHTSFADGLDYMRFTTAVHDSVTAGGMETGVH
ncbi:Gfo/Idh/MocA family protein [Synoicihabitans lomoniglobus]|uniref:Gfo/Idh/MocA family oxidoreductase n=1 Tax=Synoicihabitans lomoniglobus TaxID=2909285 RepID=A0AAE9ZWE0_9BACT|nr:Gfo/Idh/MocA family oxidoreductase [Opitutaceae bacterium LMO-M01]WED64419.1 Gfo/Idh/MocA family oxidoreductase [Opitutaceae bacterium LMO-M01]